MSAYRFLAGPGAADTPSSYGSSPAGQSAYERVYPGALTELGIPAATLTGRKAWEQWLYG